MKNNNNNIYKEIFGEKIILILIIIIYIYI